MRPRSDLGALSERGMQKPMTDSKTTKITPHEWGRFVLAIGEIAASLFAIGAVMGWI